MRRFMIAALLFGALVCPRQVEALDCGWSPTPWYRADHGGEVSTEKQRHDVEARATLEVLERTPIVFRGRITSRRYLSEPRKTNTPASLLVFDHVEILKGRLSTTSTDRKAFVIQHEWCDGVSCNDGTDAMWPRGETVVVGADANDVANPSKVMDSSGKRLIYKGRIDAVMGMCAGGRLTPIAAELLKASDDEITRLKREYLPRRPN